MILNSVSIYLLDEDLRNHRVAITTDLLPNLADIFNLVRSQVSLRIGDITLFPID